MATAQVLKLAHSIDGKVVDIDDKVTNVDDKVTGIDNKVTAIDDNVKIVIDEGKQVKLATNESKRIMQQTADSVDEVKRNQLQQDLRRWLSPPDPSINHNIARATHHSGTASWFFQGSIFNDWKSSGSLLWVHGKPGSGKSILWFSTIIQDTEVMCEAGIASMAYFYFDFRTPINKIATTFSPLFLPSYPLAQIILTIYYPTFILHTTMAGDSPAMMS
ncbi:hypothetical protein B0F90DRAFT_288549 [Multifurca ochricompacta]|uniref:Nephrocystin 3-like N-terminal domain-containing protein n=1 Tax=Multifurca ochricompacta TaxID=376703 RepID=A0AAD4M6R4_9AGAM|nr:hypothetical protein B0F90DRAFT_288549 [Multifurca ochricompacta]